MDDRKKAGSFSIDSESVSREINRYKFTLSDCSGLGGFASIGLTFVTPLLFTISILCMIPIVYFALSFAFLSEGPDALIASLLIWASTHFLSIFLKNKSKRALQKTFATERTEIVSSLGLSFIRRSDKLKMFFNKTAKELFTRKDSEFSRKTYYGVDGGVIEVYEEVRQNSIRITIYALSKRSIAREFVDEPEFFKEYLV
jgi:hypothetical protein